MLHSSYCVFLILPNELLFCRMEAGSVFPLMSLSVKRWEASITHLTVFDTMRTNYECDTLKNNACVHIAHCLCLNLSLSHTHTHTVSLSSFVFVVFVFSHEMDGDAFRFACFSEVQANNLHNRTLWWANREAAHVNSDWPCLRGCWEITPPPNTFFKKRFLKRNFISLLKWLLQFCFRLNNQTIEKILTEENKSAWTECIKNPSNTQNLHRKHNTLIKL